MNYRQHSERPWELEPELAAHRSAMTTERLHGKAEIAEELAFRDRRISTLQKRIEKLNVRRAADCEAIANAKMALAELAAAKQENARLDTALADRNRDMADLRSEFAGECQKNAKLRSALKHSFETLHKLRPDGHEGDEESGEHDADCALCDHESAMAHIEAALSCEEKP